MRGFQIWPQNSNRITFDSFFGKKEPSKSSTYSVNCGHYFGQKKLNVIRFEFLRQGLESSHHLPHLKHPVVIISLF